MPETAAEASNRYPAANHTGRAVAAVRAALSVVEAP